MGQLVQDFQIHFDSDFSTRRYTDFNAAPLSTAQFNGIALAMNHFNALYQESPSPDLGLEKVKSLPSDLDNLATTYLSLVDFPPRYWYRASWQSQLAQVRFELYTPARGVARINSSKGSGIPVHDFMRVVGDGWSITAVALTNLPNESTTRISFVACNLVDRKRFPILRYNWTPETGYLPVRIKFMTCFEFHGNVEAFLDQLLVLKLSI